MKRRTFIHQSAMGSVAAMASTPFHRIDLMPKLLNVSSDNETLQKAKKNIHNIRQRDTRIQFLNREGSPLSNQWTTNITLTTDKSGYVNFRGFCGQYTAKLNLDRGPAIGHRFMIDRSEELNSHVIKTVLK